MQKMVPLYARGMTVREIQKHLHELYAVDVSPAPISGVTNAVLPQTTVQTCLVLLIRNSLAYVSWNG